LINIAAFLTSMIITGKISEVREFVAGKGGRVGFVPTMGALHPGHISLVRRCRDENAVSIASIFVNPTQFNDPKDLLKYPRTPESDHRMLEDAGLDLLFEPQVAEIYPQENRIEMDFGPLERVMEGAHRPGHFNGVVTVVSRLFDIVRPDKAYFGEKDFQQLAIIREWARRVDFPVEIIGCPTLRESDGLAMSSRNIHLSPAERAAAPLIYKALNMAAVAIRSSPVSIVAGLVRDMIESFSGFKVQYIEFVDSNTLQPIEQYIPGREQRACIAVLTSSTRLIDNIAL
jgi:pantoate--beta-alanine ligase